MPLTTDIPTVASTAEITLGGEARTLKYGFRAYKALGLNPFDLESIEAAKLRPVTIDSVAELIRAGLLHEYAKSGRLAGQSPPTVDEIIDLLDMESFVALNEKMMLALGTGDAPEKEAEEKLAEGTQNPPAA